MDRCRYRGAVTQRDRSSFAARRWMEGKGTIHRHFSWGAFPGAMGRPPSSSFYAIIKAMPRGQLLQAKKERMKPDEENCCDCYWC